MGRQRVHEIDICPTIKIIDITALTICGKSIDYRTFACGILSENDINLMRFKNEFLSKKIVHKLRVFISLVNVMVVLIFIKSGTSGPSNISQSVIIRFFMGLLVFLYLGFP